MIANMEALVAKLGSVRVVPVVTIERAADAVPLARALVRGGLSVVEITLRTPAALEAIALVAHDVPECRVGAGTVVSASQVDDAHRAGARFLVSPGWSKSVTARAVQTALPLISGVATPSEVMHALSSGATLLKVFPAELLGGVAFVRTLSQVFPQARWFPTGGIGLDSHATYLSTPNVVCVGGSWMVQAQDLAEGRFDEIERRARACAQLVQGQGAAPAQGRAS